MNKYTVHFKSGKILVFHSDDNPRTFACNVLDGNLSSGLEYTGVCLLSDSRGKHIAIFPNSIEYIETDEEDT